MKPLLTLLLILTGYSVFAEKLNVDIEVLSWSPRIVIYHQFLSPEECDYLIEISKPYLTPSTVVDETKPNGRKIDKRRNSEGMAFPRDHQDPTITDIENRISLLTLIPPENGENIQVLHYHLGGEFQPHYDYFKSNTTGGASFLKMGGQRVASFLMYLNAPENGGATVFPKVGIEIQPVKGDALLFFDCHLDGSVDTQTLHGGAPVTGGEKWLATRWLRQNAYR